MKLVLGTFARGGLEAIWGRDLSAGVRTALRRYAREPRGSDPVDLRGARGLGDSGVEFELPLDGATEAALALSARELGVTVERMAAHAVLVYLTESEASAPPPRLSLVGD